MCETPRARHRARLARPARRLRRHVHRRLARDGRIAGRHQYQPAIDPDTDGFSVSIDGGDRAVRRIRRQRHAARASTTGAHSVQLSGLAENCQVNGANPQSVVAGSDGTATLTFEVRCAQATTGGFLVLVTTIGEGRSDGYLLDGGRRAEPGRSTPTRARPSPT